MTLLDGHRCVVALALRRARGMSRTGGVAPERVPAGEAAAPPALGHVSPEVAGHVRTGRLRSIRLRLLLPIVVATAGLVVLGAVQTQFAVRTSLDARRAQVMASTATATVRLVHRLEQEIAEIDALRARGGSAGNQLVTAAEAQTDLANTRFHDAAIAAAEHLGAQQRDLLSPVFRRGTFAPGEVAQLAQLVGAQDERLAEFTRSATPGQLGTYNQLMGSDDVTASQKIRNGTLAARPDAGAFKVDPDAWYIAQSNALRHLNDLQLTLSDTLDATSRDRQVRAQTSSVLTGTATGLLVLLAFSAALLFGVRTSRRLRGLRSAALAVAYTELPGAISALSRAEESGQVRAALHESVGHADKLPARGADEIGEGGSALGAVHRQALRLAAEQALLRLDVAGVFVALSPRRPSLVHPPVHPVHGVQRGEA